jgi:hypothetical protein
LDAVLDIDADEAADSVLDADAVDMDCVSEAEPVDAETESVTDADVRLCDSNDCVRVLDADVIGDCDSVTDAVDADTCVSVTATAWRGWVCRSPAPSPSSTLSTS